MTDRLLEVKNLKKYFPTPKGLLHAVDDVNFHIDKGETLGLVGESGCGKSTTGRLLIRLLPATGGEVLYNGGNVLALNRTQVKEARKKMQIVFQDPYSSLNPAYTVGWSLEEPLRIYGKWNELSYSLRVDQILRKQLQDEAKQRLNDWMERNKNTQDGKDVKKLLDKQ